MKRVLITHAATAAAGAGAVVAALAYSSHERLELARHVLRGRPLAYRLNLHAMSVRERNTRVQDCHITPPPNATTEGIYAP